MNDDTRDVYAPLDTLKPIAKNLWIVDGPVIRFGLAGLKAPFPTRMTVVRLVNGGLFIHSPTRLTRALKAEIEAAGDPRWIVGPNRLHYSWIPEWKAAFARASVYLAPRIKEQAGRRIGLDGLPLEGDSGYPWDCELATLPVAGSYMTEFTFFHHASRTLILTDLIENFEPRKISSFLMRWLTRVGGAQDPNGGMPRDMRLSFSRRRPQLKRAIETMIGWNPERIIVAHGRWFRQDGADELRRAFRWLLD